MSVELLLGARLLLAGMLLVAGVAKLVDRRGARQAVVDFGVPTSLARPVALALPVLELVLAGALLPAASTWWAALGTAALLTLFTLAIALSLASGRAPDCGCFGQLHRAPVGWPTIARNAGLLVVAVVLIAQGSGGTGPDALAWPGELGAYGVAALGLLLVVGATVLVRLSGRRRAGAPTGASAAGLPVGDPAPRFSALDLDAKMVALDDLLASRRPVMLVLTDADCGPCAAMAPEIAAWQRIHADTLTVVEVTRGSIERAREKRDAHGLTRILVRADGEIAAAYHATLTPSALIVRSNGTIGSGVAAGRAAIVALLQHELGQDAEVQLEAHAPPTTPSLRTDVWELPFSRRQGIATALLAALFTAGRMFRPSEASAACSQCPTHAPQCCREDPPICCTPDEVCCPELDGCCPPKTRCGVRGPVPCIPICDPPQHACGKHCCCDSGEIVCGSACCGPKQACTRDNICIDCPEGKAACIAEVERTFETKVRYVYKVRHGGNREGAFFALGGHIESNIIRRQQIKECERVCTMP